MRSLIVLFATLFLSVSFSYAQVLKPVKWTMEHQSIGSDEYELSFHATMKDKWVIYSQHTPEGGPIPTSFNFDDGAHFTKVGKVEEIGKKKEAHEPLFGVDVIKFNGGKVKFVQKVKVTDYTKPIVGYLEFMTCNDATCLPPTEVDFEFKIEKPAVAEVQTDEGQKEEKPKGEDKIVTAVKKEVEETKKAITQVTPKVETPVVKKEVEKVAVPKIAEASKPEQKEEVAATNENIELGFGAQGETGSGGENPVKWTMEVKKLKDNEFELTYKAKIEEGYYIYSSTTGEDDGPIPTTFTYNDKVELVGKLKESAKERQKVYEKVFDVDVIKLKKNATFTQIVKVADAKDDIQAELEFGVCDKEGCIYASESVTANLVTLKGYIGDQPAPASNTTMALHDPEQDGVIDQRRPTLAATYAEPLGDCGDEDVATGQNYLWTFILGFLGGLVALLTPCVFPMIPLTISFFTKGSKDRASGIRNGLLYGLSIIIIYVGLGLIITAIVGPTGLNELATNNIANIIFFLVFFLLAFSFFGFYEITLPSSLANKSDALAEKGGIIGIFFMAFTLAVVSFSCTGPIIGSAIVASSTSVIGPTIVMLGFAVALALPFGLFAAFPAWLNSLPRSGSWMNSVKVVLGFLELAFAFKFLSTPDMTYGWGILGYEIFMGIWILCALGIALYLFGIIKFPHDSPIKKLSPMRIGLGLAAVAMTIYFATGFRISEKTNLYTSLKALSGYAPPVSYNYFLADMEETALDPAIKSKYSSFSKCANNLDCFKDYYEGIAYAKEVKKPILLDFTGKACVNCRKTEEHIWVEDQVWGTINDDFVLISLYADDRKKLEKTLKSKNTNKTLRNIGNKWSDFQIVNFNQNSQPLYVMMTAEEEVLAKPRGYNPDVNEYSEFLDCGLNTYKATKGGNPLGSK